MISSRDVPVRGGLAGARIKQNGERRPAESQGEHCIVLQARMLRRFLIVPDGIRATRPRAVNQHCRSRCRPQIEDTL
jgi:hypothetical protein